MPSTAPGPKIVCPNVPVGLTEELLELYYTQRAVREARELASLRAGASVAGESGEYCKAITLPGEGAFPAYGKFTLIDEEEQSSPPYTTRPPRCQRPVNELFRLYSLGGTPQEGLAQVAELIGEFMHLISAEVSMSSLSVMPSSGPNGSASVRDGHWYIEAPTSTLPGFVLPNTDSRQESAGAGVDLASSSTRPASQDDGILQNGMDNYDDAPERSPPKHILPADGEAMETLRENAQPALEKEVQLIHTHQGPSAFLQESTTRVDNTVKEFRQIEEITPGSAHRGHDQATEILNRKRSWRDEELAQALREIEDKRKVSVDCHKTAIENLEWNARRRLCHLHVCAIAAESLGNTNFQELPRKLHNSKLRFVGWPADCGFPSKSNPSLYNKDKVGRMLSAIWDGTLCIVPWKNDERPETLPPLFIDDKGERHRLPSEVVGQSHEPPRPRAGQSSTESKGSLLNSRRKPASATHIDGGVTNALETPAEPQATLGTRQADSVHSKPSTNRGLHGDQNKSEAPANLDRLATSSDPGPVTGTKRKTRSSSSRDEFATGSEPSQARSTESIGPPRKRPRKAAGAPRQRLTPD